MRNLLDFIWRFRNTLLFVLMEVVALVMLFTYNNYHQVRFFTWTSEISGQAYESVNNLTDYLSLKESNEQLAEDNMRLRNLLNESYLERGARFDVLVDSTWIKQFSFQRAKVLNNSINKIDNNVLIDKGSNHGLEEDMGVIGPQGLVGIVTDVSANFSTVMPLIHSQYTASVKLKKNQFFGGLKWDGEDPSRVGLYDIPNHVDLVKGDTVITRYASGVYPEGVVVGTIDDWEEIPATGFWKISVKLATNFRNLDYVYIVRNELKTEIIQHQE